MKTTRTRAAALALACVVALATPAAAGDPAAELKAIDAELQAEFKEFRAASEAAGEGAGELWQEFARDVIPEFGERYAVIGRAHAKSDVALQAWTKLFGLSGMGLEGPLLSEALAAIVRDHGDSPKAAEVATNMRWSPIGEDEKLGALRTLSASPNREVQAAALLSLGAVLGDDRPAGDPRIEEAKQVLAKLSAYGDLKAYDGRLYTEAASAFLFALENLVVGKSCPDFDAVDVEGAKFKLSDYAGKVVLIDFWGFW